MSAEIPLCLDLDGTLIKIDTLYEAALLLIKNNLLYFFKMLIWLSKGRSYLKQQVFLHADLSIEHLPYLPKFVDFIKAEHMKGRDIYLVTASHKLIAEKVKAKFPFIKDVIATCGQVNLKGKQKQAELNNRFGKKGYDYAGNSHADIHIWQDARKAIIVNATEKLIQKANKTANVTNIFAKRNFKLKTYIKALRIHQYAKNILVFVPLLAGHMYWQLPLLLNGILAFIAFSLLASTVYIINDLIDLEADRQHQTKRYRPFASGELSIQTGLILIPILLLFVIGICIYMPIQYTMILIIYYFITFAYSFYLKRKVLLDVLVLAILYTMRIIAGIAAIGAIYSVWLLSFSIFFFLSLAFVKRYSELYFAAQANKKALNNRGYLVSDLPFISQFGIASGYLSVLVFALYINSNVVQQFYRVPEMLWFTCIILLYWISRIWILATRGQVHEDPVLFAISDKTSLFGLFLIALTTVLATLI